MYLTGKTQKTNEYTKKETALLTFGNDLSARTAGIRGRCNYRERQSRIARIYKINRDYRNNRIEFIKTQISS